MNNKLAPFLLFTMLTSFGLQAQVPTEEDLIKACTRYAALDAVPAEEMSEYMEECIAQEREDSEMNDDEESGASSE